MKTAVGGGSGGADLSTPLKDEDYALFAKVLNSSSAVTGVASSSGSPERIAYGGFKKGLLKYGLVCREEDCQAICFEINPNGGDLLVSAIRAKIVGRDPKLSNLLKRYIRTVLDHQQGSTRDRVLGKIISRAGETMTPEINLLRSSMSAYKYIDEGSALLDIKDDVIDIVPLPSGAPNTNPSSGQRSYYPAVADNPTPQQPSAHVAPSAHSSSRDRVLGKIISNAVGTVSSNQPVTTTVSGAAAPAPDLTPRQVSRGMGHSARDKVLAKIISSAVSAAGGAPHTPFNDPPTDPHEGALEPEAHLRGRETEKNDDCALQDYTDDQTPIQTKSYIGRAQNQGSQLEPKVESRRRVTYDPEKHSSLYQSTPSNEYFQVDLIDTGNDHRVLDREMAAGALARADSRPRRRSENSISGNPELAEQMQAIREKERRRAEDLPDQLYRSPSKKPPASGGGRVRNKILNRMVNRVRGTMLPSDAANTERPSSASREEQLKEKSLSPSHEPGRKWFHGSKVAIDNSSVEQSPGDVRSPVAWDNNHNHHLRIQTLESRPDGAGDFKQQNSPQRRESKERFSSSEPSPNPLRHILSDARLVIPPSEASFSPGGTRFSKASPVHLSVSTPQQPYRETYRRTANLYPGPEDRALTPEPCAESADGLDEPLSPSGWSKRDKETGHRNSNPQTLKDKWVGAAPVQLGGVSSSEQCHRITGRELAKKLG
jgi:hypothetical protein